MDIENDRIEYAVRHTEILRAPRQTLSTFGITNIYYYLVTEPVYSELVKDVTETVIREGRVISQRPKIVTPYYLSRLEGFSADARRYFDTLIKMHGADAPGLFYTYKNEPKGLNIVADSLQSVVSRINEDIDKRGDPLASIIKGEDALWDVSLMKFVYELTKSSLQNNLTQLGSRGLLHIDASGVPADARLKIEELFRQVARGELQHYHLERELHRWDVFEEYQDRFFALVKGRK